MIEQVSWSKDNLSGEAGRSEQAGEAGWPNQAGEAVMSTGYKQGELVRQVRWAGTGKLVPNRQPLTRQKGRGRRRTGQSASE